MYRLLCPFLANYKPIFALLVIYAQINPLAIATSLELPHATETQLPVCDHFRMCLNATGMETYFHREGLLTTSFKDAANYARRIRELIPVSS